MKIREKFSGLTPSIKDQTPTKGPAAIGSYTIGTPGAFTFITHRLDSLGYSKLGQGKFGATFTHPEQPGLVLKVFEGDKAYAKFWSLAKQSDNPHFPEVAKIVRFNLPSQNRGSSLGPVSHHAVSFLATWIEKLSGVPPRDIDQDQFARVLSYAVQYGDEFNFPEKYSKRWPELFPALMMVRKIIMKQVPRASEFHDGGRMIHPYGEDIHGGNYMWRGDTPVLTDPIYPRSY